MVEDNEQVPEIITGSGGVRLPRSLAPQACGADEHQDDDEAAAQ